MARLVTRTGGRPATTGVIPGRFALSVGMPKDDPPPGWRWTLLTDVARLETGHTPSRKHPEYWGGDIPWIGIRDATAAHGQMITETAESTNQLGIDNSSARVLPENTVCLSRTASVGYVVIMGRPMATSQDFVNWTCSDKLDHRFLTHILLAEHDSLRMFASGSVHQTIYFPEVKAFHVCLPPIEEQRRIADFLGEFDDKVKLNSGISRNLEAMATALFRSWFVDFDPVHQRMNGGNAGLPPTLAALFPDTLCESSLGLVPKGWLAGTIKDLFVLQRGFDLPRGLRTAGPYPVLAASGPAGFHSSFAARGPGVVTGRSGRLGDVWLVNSDFWPLNTVLWVREFRAVGPIWACEFLRLADLARFNSGSAVPSLNRNHVHRQPALIPPAGVAAAFERLAKPLFDRSRVASEESVVLQGIRDAIMPRLLTGRRVDALTLGER